jgi:hypothetical protein
LDSQAIQISSNNLFYFIHLDGYLNENLLRDAPARTGHETATLLPAGCHSIAVTPAGTSKLNHTCQNKSLYLDNYPE